MSDAQAVTIPLYHCENAVFSPKLGTRRSAKQIRKRLYDEIRLCSSAVFMPDPCYGTG